MERTNVSRETFFVNILDVGVFWGAVLGIWGSKGVLENVVNRQI